MCITQNKTIFNLNNLKPGTAIKFRYNHMKYGTFINAIIIRGSETELEVIQFDKNTKSNTFRNKLLLRGVKDGSLNIEILN